MAEKMEDLPPSYSNLDYDSKPVPGPSAPKSHEDPNVEGKFQAPMPNPSAPLPEPEPSRGPLVYNPPNLVFEDVYEACLKYVDDHCCYNKRFLNEMRLLDVINKAVLYYKLESFGEKRETMEKCAPYKGEITDGPEYGEPPEPWDMDVIPPDLFTDCKITAIVPHTEVVRRCSKCHGSGDVTCERCEGRGKKPCRHCNGTGKRIVRGKESCLGCKECDGKGKKMCWTCIGMGTVQCGTCEGHKKVRIWKDMNAIWENHVSEFFTDMANMHDDLIREAKGVELLKEKNFSLQPITNAPDQMVNAASERILETHKDSFNDEMIIRQRQTLRAVPLTRVTYHWKQKYGEFYVYDIDRKVFFEDYPQKYCSCCCS